MGNMFYRSCYNLFQEEYLSTDNFIHIITYLDVDSIKSLLKTYNIYFFDIVLNDPDLYETIDFYWILPRTYNINNIYMVIDVFVRTNLIKKGF